MSQHLHASVMLDEVLAALRATSGSVIVDATFGRGGYSRAILQTGAKVIGLDRDPQAVAAGAELAAQNNNFHMVHTAFGEMQPHLEQMGVVPVDGVVFDLGVSSPQLDEAERGFSFRQDGPLDMRMDTTQGETAAELIDRLSERELADIIWLYGEERQSRRVARVLVERRPFTRTTELAEAVRAVVRKSKDGIDPATRTFQALRIAVNDELGELERGLDAASACLAEGGRLVVVSFHSLEDRIVKNWMRKAAGREGGPSRYVPVMHGQQDIPPAYIIEGKQPILPSAEELSRNPRARSAKLRVACKQSTDFSQSQQHKSGGV